MGSLGSPPDVAGAMTTEALADQVEPVQGAPLRGPLRRGSLHARPYASPRSALRVRGLVWHPRDPFDRWLIAQALDQGYTCGGDAARGRPAL